MAGNLCFAIWKGPVNSLLDLLSLPPLLHLHWIWCLCCPGLVGGVAIGDAGDLGDKVPLAIMLSWQLLGARKLAGGMAAMVRYLISERENVKKIECLDTVKQVIFAETLFCELEIIATFAVT